VVNNPVNGIDPDGHFHRVKKKGGFFRSIIGSIVGAVIGILTWGAGVPMIGHAIMSGLVGGMTGGTVNTFISGGDPAANIMGGAFLGGLAASIGWPMFGALGGTVGGGISWGNFFASVGTGAAVGGVTGGISTAIYGGHFGQNVGMGIVTGAVTAAAIYGGYALWNSLTASETTVGCCDKNIDPDGDGESNISPIADKGKETVPCGMNPSVRCNPGGNGPGVQDSKQGWMDVIEAFRTVEPGYRADLCAEITAGVCAAATLGVIGGTGNAPLAAGTGLACTITGIIACHRAMTPAPKGR
jgi:hypothetical protein